MSSLTKVPRSDQQKPTASDAVAIHSRPAALIFRVIAVVLSATGVILVSGLLTDAPTPSAFLFYTVQSNLLCIVWLLLLIIRTIQDIRREGVHGVSTPSARVSGAVMMAITVTMVIYLVVLLPAAFRQPGAYEPFTLTDTLVHVATPCFLILDWLLFIGKGSFRWFDPLLWALLPFAYLAFGFTAGALGVEFYPGQTFPYPFMDVARLGLIGTAAWIVGLTVAMEAVGYVYVAIDRGLGRLSTFTSSRTAPTDDESRLRR